MSEPHPWSAQFADKWCFVQTKQGAVTEGHVFAVADGCIWFKEIMMVMNEIPGVRKQEAIFFETVQAIPVAEVIIIRVADRAQAQKFCSGVNGSHLLPQGNPGPPRHLRGLN